MNNHTKRGVRRLVWLSGILVLLVGGAVWWHYSNVAKHHHESRAIIVMRGDIMHDYAVEQGLSDRIIETDTLADALELLASGAHDYALMAQLPGMYWRRELELSNIGTTRPLLLPAAYSFAVQAGDDHLRLALSEGLAILNQLGVIRQLYDKWLGVLQPRGVSLRRVVLYLAMVAVPMLVLLGITLLWSYMLRLEVSRQTADLRNSRETERFDHQFRTLVAGISAQFVQVNDSRSFDEAVNYALAGIGHLFSMDRSYLFRFSDDLSTLDNTHEWCAEGFEAQLHRSRQVPTETVPWWMARMHEGRPVHIPDVAELPADAAREKVEFQAQGIQSLLCLPICNASGQVIGFMGYDAVQAPHVWTEEQIAMQQVLAEIIGSAIIRLEAMNALRESEKRLSRAQEIAHTGSWTLDIATNRLTWSDEVYRVFGCEPQDFDATYEAFFDFVHPDDRAAVDEAYSCSLREGRDDYEIEHRIVRRHSGEVRYIHERCINERDGTGTVVQSTGMVQDITERKRAEIYREMGREILQILNEPGDLHESIQRVLAVLKSRTGVDAVGLRLQDGDDFPYFAQDGFPGDFIVAENTLVERDRDGGLCRDQDGNVCLECTCGLVLSGKIDPANPLFTKGGSSWTNNSFPFLDLPADQDPRLHPRNNCIHYGYASVALIPIRTPDRIVGLIQLNDKHKSQFTLEAIEHLENIATHIGSALMRKHVEDALRIAKERAEVASRAKTQFLANMSHELRTPMNSVLGFAQLLQCTDLDTKQEKYVRMIHASGKSLLFVIQEILDFSKVEAGKVELEIVETDMRALIRETADLIRCLADQKNVELHVDIDPAIPRFAMLDPTRLRQILFNLLSNAVKFTEEGEIEITASRAPPAGGRGRVKFSVRDTGVGIPEAHRENLFKAFSQGDNSDTRKYGGTGLGLVIADRLAQLMGGRVAFTSTPGEGSEFFFTIETDFIEPEISSPEDEQGRTS